MHCIWRRRPGGRLASRRLPNAWLSLDPADNDPARFVRYLVAALRTVRPDAGPATMALIGAGTSPSVEIAARAIITKRAPNSVESEAHLVAAATTAGPMSMPELSAKPMKVFVVDS